MSNTQRLVTLELLNRSKKAGISEYRLCKHLHKNPKYIRGIRAGLTLHIGVGNALLINDLLGLNERDLILRLVVEQSKTKREREFWKSVDADLKTVKLTGNQPKAT